MGVTLSQPNALQPQLLVRLDVKYLKNFHNQPQPENIQITGAKCKIRVNGKNQAQFEIGIAEQEQYCSLNMGDTYSLHLTLRLTPYLLHRIEELRSGGELWFQYQPLACGLSLGTQNGFYQIETLNFQINQNTWKYPKSEWIDHLNATEFDKVELIEIPKIDLPEIPLTTHIMKFLDDANKAMSDGRYGDVLLECRKSIEALESGVKEWGKKNISDQEQNNKNDLENFLGKLVGDREKAKRLNELRMTLRSYLSLDPHEAEYKNIVFIRDDGKFVLHTTIGFINNVLRYMVNTNQ